MTSFKLFLVRLLTVAGVCAVAFWQWQAAAARESYGIPGFGHGAFHEALLRIVMAGIPAVAFGVCAHFFLTWGLFRRGEIAELEARRLIKKTRRALEKETKAVQEPKTPGRVFED